MNSNLDTLFKPTNIAVIGVSEEQGKLGTVIYNNIKSAGFSGNLFAVNPKYDKLHGVKCYKSITEINEILDLIVVVIPAKYVKSVTQEAVKAKVRNMVIISAGFGETGVEGKQLEKEIYNIAKAGGVRIVGPNCLGVISNVGNLNASFSSQNPLDGNIALLSQSGAINTALLDLSLARNLGFSYFVSFGNKIDINELDLLEYWLQDDSVKVIGMYLEEFSSGREFINIVQQHTTKPIVLLYAGTSAKGKAAASSHTGSLTSDKTIIKAAMDKIGVILVDSIEKFFNTLMLFSWIDDHPVGLSTKIVTNAGGPGILATDLLSNTSAKITAPDKTTYSKLEKFLPAASSVHNPIDILGDALADRYDKSLELLNDDSETDAIIVILTPQYITEIYKTARTIITAVRKYNKPIIPIFIGDFDVYKGLSLMWKNKVPAFEFLEEAISALDSLFRYQLIEREIPDQRLIKNFVEQGQYRELIEKVISTDSSSIHPLDPVLSKALATEVNIPLPIEKVVNTVEDAITFTQQSDFPVVIKATTEDATHKTDTQLIFLDIQNKSDLVVKFNQLVNNLNSITHKEHPNVLIQEMVNGKEELFMGIKRDGNSKIYEESQKGFGHMLVFGKGGIYTEIYKDVASILLPMDNDDAYKLIDKTKVSQILYGARGNKALAVNKVVEVMNSIQKLVVLYPEISAIDFNPLFITEDRVVAVDVKMFVKA